MPREKTGRNPLGTILKTSLTRTKIVGGKEKKVIVVVWDARKRYRDADGAPQQKFRRCRTAQEASTALTNFANEIADELAAARRRIENRSAHTLFELLDYFEREYVVPAVYAGRQKIIGYEQDLSGIKYILQSYRDFFGDRPLAELYYEDLRRFYAYISQKPTVKGTAPAISTVNYYLKYLRRVLNVAIQLGWLTENPFRRGPALIRNGAENRRNRMLTFDEEARLLAECYDGEKPVTYFRRDKITKEKREVESVVWINRAYLKSVIICALDTAMRKGEIQQLQWKEIFLDENYIFIDGEKTKTGVDGLAPITDRLAAELKALRLAHSSRPDDLVFPFGDWKAAFERAARDAQITNLQFRDLRSTASTRMLLAGNAGELIRKITRHTQEKTFLDHYTNIDVENTRRVGEKLSEFNSLYISKVNDKVNGVLRTADHSN